MRPRLSHKGLNDDLWPRSGRRRGIDPPSFFTAGRSLSQHTSLAGIASLPWRFHLNSTPALLSPAEVRFANSGCGALRPPPIVWSDALRRRSSTQRLHYLFGAGRCLRPTPFSRILPFDRSVSRSHQSNRSVLYLTLASACVRISPTTRVCAPVRPPVVLMRDRPSPSPPIVVHFFVHQTIHPQFLDDRHRLPLRRLT